MTEKLILVINCGSSSLKFSLTNPKNYLEVLSGLIENVGDESATIKYSLNNNQYKQKVKAVDHNEAISHLISLMNFLPLDFTLFCISHRVVHGGEFYSEPTLINNDVINKLEILCDIAPLHNPANIQGIKAAQLAFPDIKQVAIFDTAFHQSMPKEAFLYGLPYELYENHGIRRYGFHGTSHFYITSQAPEFINKKIEETQLISVHLGNGCSVAAIKNGKSMDTSMGMTPLEGLIMGTRCGDIDPGLSHYLINHLNYSVEEIDTLFNKKSGLLGLSKLSNDCRTLVDAANDGNLQATLAIDVFCYRVARYISSLTAALTQLDAVVFTGGIGENAPLIREKVCRNLALLNCVLDKELNASTIGGKSALISSPGSTPCIVIHTNEERVLAEKAFNLITHNCESA